MRWLRRLRYWLRFHDEQADLLRELELHRELLAEEYRRRGVAATDAAIAARRAMGNQTYMREEARAVWFAPRLDAFLGDCRYAVRGLRRSPVFTIVSVLSLAIGIGANTAIFSIIHSVLLAQLPVPTAAELVQLQRLGQSKVPDERFSRDEYQALAAAPLPAAFFASSFASLDVDGVTQDVSVDAVSDGYFNLLGLRAARGRLIAAGDGDAPVAVISDRFWHSRLNGDGAAIGRTISIDGQPLTVIGITPAGFAGLRFPSISQISIPYRTAATLHVIRERDAKSQAVTIIGRRARSQSLDVLAHDVGALWRRCCADGALITANDGRTAVRSTLRLIDISRGIPQTKVDLRGHYRSILLTLMAGVALLLLAACANLANLLLARSSSRDTELAVRVALGASRPRVVSQLIVESAVLALLGACAGVLVAWWATAILSRANIGDLSGVIAPNPSGSVLAFTLAISVASVLLFGLAPAVRAVRPDLLSSLRQGARTVPVGARHWFDRALVALQVALAVLLVCGAALLVQTLRNLRNTRLGFDPADRLTLSVETRHTAYESQGMTVPMTDAILQRVRAVADVQSATFASIVPVVGGRWMLDNVTVRGALTPADADEQTAFVGVSPGYFSTMGMPILRGRDLGPLSPGPTPNTREVLVNESFVRKFFPNRDPIGQVFQDADEGDSAATDNRIVGVVGDARFVDVRDRAVPMFFVPVADHEWPYLELVFRPKGASRAAIIDITRSIRELAPGITVSGATPVSAAVRGALVRERMAAELATVFGLVALGLVAVGLYGVLLYRVAERAREIGIRMALGAGGGRVLRLVLRQSMGVVGIGLALGVPLAMLAGRMVSSELYGVAPYDPVVLTIAVGLVVASAALACIVPVRRAIAIDPLVALQSE